MISTIGSKHAQVIWQEDEEGTPEKAILVTNYAGSGLIEIKQRDSLRSCQLRKYPRTHKAMKTVKGMRD